MYHRTASRGCISPFTLFSFHTSVSKGNIASFRLHPKSRELCVFFSNVSQVHNRLSRINVCVKIMVWKSWSKQLQKSKKWNIISVNWLRRRGGISENEKRKRKERNGVNMAQRYWMRAAPPWRILSWKLRDITTRLTPSTVSPNNPTLFGLSDFNLIFSSILFHYSLWRNYPNDQSAGRESVWRWSDEISWTFKTAPFWRSSTLDYTITQFSLSDGIGGRDWSVE